MGLKVNESESAGVSKKALKLFVSRDGVELTDLNGNKKKVERGTILQCIGKTTGNKKFNVIFEKQAYTVSIEDATFQKPKEIVDEENKKSEIVAKQKAKALEEAAKQKAKALEEAAKKEEAAKALELSKTLDGYLTTDEGKVFDAKIRSMFNTPLFGDKGKDALDAHIKDLEKRIYEGKEQLTFQLTFKDIDDSTVKKGTFSDTHYLKWEYRNKGTEVFDAGKIVLGDEETPFSRAEALLLSQIFIKDEGAAKAAADKVATQNWIDAKQAKELFGIDAVLFDLIDRNSDTAGRADGKITMSDAARFVTEFKDYVKEVCDGNEEIAIRKFKNAPGFDMVDKIKNTAEKVEKEWNVNGKTTFKDLKAKINPDLLPALTARIAKLKGLKKGEDVTNETTIGDANVKAICLFIASLPHRSRLDGNDQVKLMGEKLPQFNEDPSTENFWKYVKAKQKPETADGKQAEKTEEKQEQKTENNKKKKTNRLM